ncbi:MAG: hypothetical protein JWP01_3814 [Myxococcales bacterium]|nr:hypothetical protein [Myxococcales bacterium]
MQTSSQSMRLRAVLSIVVSAGCGQMYGTPNPPPQPPQQGAATEGPPGSDPWQEGAGDPGGASGPVDPVAASAPTSAPRGGAPGRPAAASSNLPAEAQLLLDTHNGYRAQHCAKPLTWSPKLAEVAQQWANKLRDKGCAFEHSGGAYGENLAAGTSGALDARSTVAMWYDEVKGYSFKQPGFSMQTGHFTQVVWTTTTQVGCGKSTCKGMDIWVCEYDPPGNWEGQYPAHVLPTSCKK